MTTQGNRPTAFVHLGETLTFQNPVFRMVNAVFRSPSGETFDRDIVRHPGAVAVLPLHADGTVTLVSQFRGAVGMDLLEIPAGLLDHLGEDEPAAASRELREEVGLEASQLDLLISYHAAVGFTDERITIFVGTGLTDVGSDVQGPEEGHMSVHRIALSEARAMVADGRITDGKTVIALLMVNPSPTH
jgi:8-oxo-dGDP phosphatase